VPLVQDRCPVGCQNLDCTCLDKKFSFVTEVLKDTATNGTLEPSRTRDCLSLYGMAFKNRNLVCHLNIHAINNGGNSKSLKVFNLCPKACGLRKECFCKDSKGLVSTPDRGVKFRHCKDASAYTNEARTFFL